MYKKNKRDIYFYQYIIIFLIYIGNTIKYYIGLEEKKKIKLAKIHPVIQSTTSHDEEIGIGDLDCVFIFNPNTNNLVGQYYMLSKQKQD